MKHNQDNNRYSKNLIFGEVSATKGAYSQRSLYQIYGISAARANLVRQAYNESKFKFWWYFVFIIAGIVCLFTIDGSWLNVIELFVCMVAIDLIGRAMAAAGDRLEKGREELGERIGSIGSSLETAKTTVGRRMDARAAFRKEAVVDAAKRFESVLAKRQKSVLSMDMLTKRMLKGNPSASSSLEGFDVIKKNAMEEAVQK